MGQGMVPVVASLPAHTPWSWSYRDGDGDGVISAARAGPGVLRITVAGFLRCDAAPVLVAGLGAFGRLERLRFSFVDARWLHGYDDGFREHLTYYQRDVRPQLEAVHLLTRSRLVLAGVTVANMVLQGLVRSTRDPAVFEALLEQACLPYPRAASVPRCVAG